MKLGQFFAEILHSEYQETLESILKCTVFLKLKAERSFNRQV